MKKLAQLVLVLMGMLVALPAAQAHGRRDCCEDRHYGRRHADTCCATTCCEKPAITYVDKKVTCYKPVWKEKEVKETVYKRVAREEVVKHTCTVMEPQWREEKRTCTVYKRVAREVEREVTRCRYERVCCVDPCTGCTYTVRKPVTELRKVRCTVWDCVPEHKDYTRKVKYCEMVPYETTVKVAVCENTCCSRRGHSHRRDCCD
jgi:hypothetical protein